MHTKVKLLPIFFSHSVRLFGQLNGVFIVKLYAPLMPFLCGCCKLHSHIVSIKQNKIINDIWLRHRSILRYGFFFHTEQMAKVVYYFVSRSDALHLHGDYLIFVTFAFALPLNAMQFVALGAQRIMSFVFQ